MSIKEKMLSLADGYGMFGQGEKVLLGLSGGADSVTLLHLLLDCGVSLSAAHVNHMIRGEEADRDENFCRQLCERLGVPFYSVKIDIPSIAEKRKTGLEETARDERYAYFERLADEIGADRIVVAHNADDNRETVLFNLTRGCGLNGLCGIQPVRGRIIRPLLECTKTEIIGYCLENGFEYVTDSTNSDTEYTRNLLRHRVIPVLRQINTCSDKNFIVSMRHLRSDSDYLEAEAKKFSLGNGRNTLKNLPDPILSRVLLSDLREDGLRPESGHIERLVSFLRSDEVNFSLFLPGGKVSVNRDLIKTEKYCEPAVERPEIPFETGFTEISDSEAVILTESGNFEALFQNFKNVYILSTRISLNSGIISHSLSVRGRRNGDTIRYGNMTRKLKKLFNGKKLLIDERKSLPLFTADGKIFLMPGFPQADFSKGSDFILAYLIKGST